MKRPTKAEQKSVDTIMKKLLKDLLEMDSKFYSHIANCRTCIDSYHKMHSHAMKEIENVKCESLK